MDFMKVFDQTVREIKREVNLKVLKVPEIEQKVLDATDNEPWGPHGSDLAEISKATKKFSECQLVMNVLWTRLSETGKDWRHVYKALTVIEYLVANGSERAVDEVIEHTFQISSLSGFEFVEPSGKDVGINVRKKVETIVALLNDKDKIQEVRKKATANRDKYVGLSSTGITNKSSSTSYGSSFQKRDLYDDSRDGKERDSFRDNNKEGDEKFDKDSYAKSRRGVTNENQGKTIKKGSSRYSSKDQGTSEYKTSKPSSKTGDSEKYGAIHSQSPSLPLSNEDDFDDFDPRGTSTTKSAVGSSNQVDLFGDSFVGDLMDAPSVPVEVTVTSNISTEVDLFADAAFVSAAPSSAGAGAGSQTQAPVDLFASEPAFPPASSSTIDLFDAPVPVIQTESKSPKSKPINTNTVDPFASVPLNNFDGSDTFSAFTSHTDSVSQGPTKNHGMDGNLNNLNGKPSPVLEPPPKKDSFQVKSGVWADSLSRGLIDLNISAPKKASLVDIGVVGGLSDGSDERDLWGPATSFSMGRAMGAGSGIGTSGFTPSTTTVGNDFFLNRNSQQHAMGAGSGLGNSGFNPSTTSSGNDFFSSLSGQEYQYGNFKK